MQAYQENISAKVNGVLTPILGVKVTVTDDSTGNPATLFSDNGVTQITSDIVTDETGYFGFFAANGSYTVSFSSPQIRLAPRNIDLYDPLDDAPLTQSQAASPSGASRLGYGQRSVENKLGEFVSVKDDPFNAKGDGITDDTEAVRAFLNYLKANGGKGIMPSGTYNISYIDIDLSGNKPFALVGDGIGKTVLKCTAPTFNFLTFRNCAKVSVRHLTFDGGFQAGQTATTSTAFIWVNANDCAVDYVAAINVQRIAFMAYNDHQTTLANVYSGVVYDHCYVDGGASYVAGTGPSAFIVADYNNSRITNSYIKNIGLYGYEFKNDSSNCMILNCIAENVFNAVYFGGDGAHSELGYVKHSLVDNVIINGGTNPVFMDWASYNTVRNIRIDNTGRAGMNYIIGIRDTSNYNTVSGVEVMGRGNAFLFDLRLTANNNVIEFANIVDGTSTQIGGAVDNTCSGNRVVFGTRDSTQTLIPATIYNNTFIDATLNREHLNIAASTIKKSKLGDVGNDSTFTTAKGFAYLGDTCDTFIATKQDYQFQYVGSFTKPDIYAARYQLSVGEKRDTLFHTDLGTSSVYVTNRYGYYPNADITKTLGIHANRWLNIYSQNVVLNPPSSVTPANNGDMTFQATSDTAIAIKYRGSDGVVRSATLTLA